MEQPKINKIIFKKIQITKTSEILDYENILKEAKEKWHIIHKRMMLKMIVNFSSEKKKGG